MFENRLIRPILELTEHILFALLGSSYPEKEVNNDWSFSLLYNTRRKNEQNA